MINGLIMELGNRENSKSQQISISFYIFTNNKSSTNLKNMFKQSQDPGLGEKYFKHTKRIILELSYFYFIFIIYDEACSNLSRNDIQREK